MTNTKTTNQNNTKLYPSSCHASSRLLSLLVGFLIKPYSLAIFAAIFKWQFQCPKSANWNQISQNVCHIRQPVWFHLTEAQTTVIWMFKLLVSVTKHRRHEFVSIYYLWLITKCTKQVLLEKLLVKKWKSKVHHFAYKSEPLDTNLGQMTPVHNFRSCFLTIHSNILFLTKPRSSMQSLSFMLSNQDSVCISLALSHVCNMLCPSDCPWFHPKY